jgi:DNA-binding CsgD family transcriptional regulator
MELSCLALVANGYRSHEIGNVLKASTDDIDTVLSEVERKLGAKNRLHAIGIAVSQGLIGIDATHGLIGNDSK